MKWKKKVGGTEVGERAGMMDKERDLEKEQNK